MNFEENTYKLSLIKVLYILMKGKAIENDSQFGINVKICNKQKVEHIKFGVRWVCPRREFVYWSAVSIKRTT